MTDKGTRPTPPESPHACGGRKFWLRPRVMVFKDISPAGWLCYQCYPPFKVNDIRDLPVDHPLAEWNVEVIEV